MDNKTEEGLKRMVQDYEYETTGIPQRLDHVLMAGLERGLAQADLKEQQIDIQVETVVKSAKQVAKKATYENLKKIFFDYEKMYDDAVKENKVKNKKGTKSKKIIKNIFGLASLGSLALGISMCFFEGDNVPAILSPFKDGGDMLFMFAFVVFGVVWWILQATTSLSGRDSEYSGEARIYQNAMHVILEEGLEKRFEDRFYKDKDFHEYNDMDIWEEDD